MKELEAENARLRRMYVEEKLKAEIVREVLEKSGDAVSLPRDGPTCRARPRRFVSDGSRGVQHQPDYYRYVAKTDGENEEVANWLLRLTDGHRNWGFGLCFLNLRDVRGSGWNYERVYWIYRELELNLRIKRANGWHGKRPSH